jgi:hypothetical protein
MSSLLSSITRNATTARSGYRAETILCEQASVRAALVKYFGRGPIVSMVPIGGRKKSDVRVTFADGGATINIQNKDGDGSGRGWSVDRRDLGEHIANPAFQTLLANVCLRHEGERPTVTDEVPMTVLTYAICGDDVANEPDILTHTQCDPATGVIQELSIAPMATVMEALYDELYPDMVPKRTCVHLSPSIYLQRKGGGGATETRPDQIQMKWRRTPSLTAVLTRLPLCASQYPPSQHS